MKTAFEAGELPIVGSEFRLGRINWHNPQINRSLCTFRHPSRACRRTSAPRWLGTAERGRTEARCNLAIAFPDTPRWTPPRFRGAKRHSTGIGPLTRPSADLSPNGARYGALLRDVRSEVRCGSVFTTSPHRERSAKGRVVVFGEESRFFQAAVCRGLSQQSIGSTSDSQQSKPTLDEDPRKKSRAKWQYTSKNTANYCRFLARSGHSSRGSSPSVTWIYDCTSRVRWRVA